MKPIHWILCALLFVGIGTASFFSNSQFQNMAPGQSDNLLSEMALASDQLLVLKAVPRANDTKKPNRTLIATLRGEEVKNLLRTVRLNDRVVKKMNRDFQYRIRFQRGNRIIGALDIYFHRDWAYLQAPADELDSPFEDARVLQPTYGPKLQAFLTALEK